jgi:hypothetical protein
VLEKSIHFLWEKSKPGRQALLQNITLCKIRIDTKKL